MPTNKDLKRLVRARMQKTGEAYTAARAQIISKNQRAPNPALSAAKGKDSGPDPSLRSGQAKPDYAAIAGMSDKSLKAATGCTWERWVKSLDYHGADKLSHREIAQLVKAKYDTPSWWTQTVTVGYERIKGLRTRGQQRNGSYTMNKSRTYNVPVAELFAAWSDPDIRRRWLKGAGVRVRTATAPRSIRLDVKDHGIAAIGFVAKGKSKSSVAIEHMKLPDREAAESLKAFWSEHLDALAGILKPSA